MDCVARRTRGARAYSTLLALPDGRVGLLYERGDKSAYERLTFATCALDWLESGRDGVDRGRQAASGVRFALISVDMTGAIGKFSSSMTRPHTMLLLRKAGSMAATVRSFSI